MVGRWRGNGTCLGAEQCVTEIGGYHAPVGGGVGKKGTVKGARGCGDERSDCHLFGSETCVTEVGTRHPSLGGGMRHKGTVKGTRG